MVMWQQTVLDIVVISWCAMKYMWIFHTHIIHVCIYIYIYTVYYKIQTKFQFHKCTFSFLTIKYSLSLIMFMCCVTIYIASYCFLTT